MNILIAHSTKYDYESLLYTPLLNSHLASEHHIELPHKDNRNDFDSRDYIKNKANLVILEATVESAGAWMEAGIAIGFGVPVGVIFRKGIKLKLYILRYAIHKSEYSTTEEMISGVEEIIKKCIEKQHKI